MSPGESKTCKFISILNSELISKLVCLIILAYFIILKIFLLDIYRETIPSDAPPSYKGQAVKYSYKITIGTQRVNTVIKLLRVPFRVLSLSGNKFESLKKKYKANIYRSFT